MSSFNSTERRIARVLIKFPVLKRLVKILYARVSYLYCKKQYKYSSDYRIYPVVRNTRIASFYGYYDCSPDSSDEVVLAHLHSSNNTWVKPSPNIPMTVCLIKKEESEPLFKYQSKAYNWQQGSRAQWLTNDLFIFNDFDENKNCYISRVFSKKTCEEIKQFDFPVQDSFKDKYFLSLNYRRLSSLRPDYGYRNMPAMSSRDINSLVQDGIWRVEYDTQACCLLLTLEEISKFEANPDSELAIHKVNHVMISPDGERYLFLHRYYLGKVRYDRLILASSRSKNMKLLSNYGMISHYFWANNNTIVGYMRGPDFVDSYWVIEVDTGDFRRLTVLDGFGDGHPHVFGDWFVTDTYPDKSRMQNLFLVNWKTDEKIHLGEFYHGFKYSGESRCDLHPRFSLDGKYIFFDSVFDDTRRLYKLTLE